MVALSVSLEITKISLSANATRCRNWSGPVSTVCHHSDSSQFVGVLAARHRCRQRRWDIRKRRVGCVELLRDPRIHARRLHLLDRGERWAECRLVQQSRRRGDGSQVDGRIHRVRSAAPGLGFVTITLSVVVPAGNGDRRLQFVSKTRTSSLRWRRRPGSPRRSQS